MRHLMKSRTNFANEVSQLEHIKQRIRCKVIITTKYYAEYVDEGIKYTLPSTIVKEELQKNVYAGINTL